MKKAVMFLAVAMACTIAAAQSGTGSATGAAQNNSRMTQADEEITNGPVAELVSDSQATIGWSVRSAGNMTISYGTERTQMNQTARAVQSSDGRNLHVHLQGLTPNTQYYFQVMQDGQPLGGIGTFHTVSVGDPPEKSKAVIPR